MAPRGAWLSRKKKSLLLFGLLGQKHSLDVGEDTTLGDGDSGEKLVEFLVVADGVAHDDESQR